MRYLYELYDLYDLHDLYALKKLYALYVRVVELYGLSSFLAAAAQNRAETTKPTTRAQESDNFELGNKRLLCSMIVHTVRRNVVLPVRARGCSRCSYSVDITPS